MRGDTREHVASYYAATASERTDYPSLDGSHRCDVAVVGGGFTGLSAALTLAERGYSVVLLEANRIGWGASGRNGGQLVDGFVEVERVEKRLGAEAAAVARQMGLDCRDRVIEIIDRYSIDCDLRFGYLDLALNEHDIRAFHEDLEDKAAHGYPHEVYFVPRESLPGYIGSERYVAGLVNLGNGHLHTLNLCIGEARAAASLGVSIFEQTPAIRIRHGNSPEVHTESGIVRADKVILAGNAYLGRIEPRISRQVIAAGSYVIATDRLPEALATELLPRDMAACDQRIRLDYFRLSADRRLLFGGMCNYSGRDPKDIAATLAPRMRRVFPQLADVGIEFQWGGYIGISLNRIPQLGRIQGNTYYAQGYSGHGVAPTHLAGQILADAVAGDSERFDVFARIRHLQLPGGRWFANPAVALGMIYFELKQALTHATRRHI